jgi:hypothetical protein
MGPFVGVDYNVTLCPLQSRLQHIYHVHGQPTPYARVDLARVDLSPVRDLGFASEAATLLLSLGNYNPWVSYDCRKADGHKLISVSFAFLLLQGTSVFDLKMDEHLKNLKSADPLLKTPDLYIFVEFFKFHLVQYYVLIS